jgi:hypothetical protein
MRQFGARSKVWNFLHAVDQKKPVGGQRRKWFVTLVDPLQRPPDWTYREMIWVGRKTLVALLKGNR